MYENESQTFTSNRSKRMSNKDTTVESKEIMKGIIYIRMIRIRFQGSIRIKTNSIDLN